MKIYISLILIKFFKTTLQLTTKKARIYNYNSKIMQKQLHIKYYENDFDEKG
jgi:hypothetical protein